MPHPHLKLIARELEKARGSSKNSLKGLVTKRIVPAMLTFFSEEEKVLDPVRTDFRRHEIVRNAAFDATKTPPITASKLKSALQSRVSTHQQLGTNDYVVVTQVSAKLPKRQTVHPPKAWITITSKQEFPRRFSRGVERALNQPGVGQDTRPFDHLWWVRTRVKARYPEDAHEIATKDLDALRGIWIFQMLYGKFRSESATNNPASPIVTGPLFTVHEPNGDSIPNTGIWRRLNYLEPLPLMVISDSQWKSIRAKERSIRKKLTTLPADYRNVVWKAFGQYANALDDNVWSTVLLNLWGILESLTGKDKNHRQETVARRAASPFPDPELHEMILQHLRRYRNNVAHEGQWRKDVVALVFELKRHVEKLFEFHLMHGRNFGSVEEAGEFLDLRMHAPHLKRAVKFFAP